MDVINASIKLPKLKTKTVWAGMYGGHYNVIVFFHKKPLQAKEEHNHIDGKWYDLDDENQKRVCGSMWLPDFEELYPDANLGKPTAIEIDRLFRIKLTTYWEDHYGVERIKKFETHADGY